MSRGNNHPKSSHDTAPKRRTLVLTSDLDWAPDYVLEDALELFDSCGVPVTILATHETSLLNGLDRSRYEVGIHPDFNQLLAGGGGTSHTVVESLLEIFPEAVCVRAHCLTESTRILNIYAEMGLRYDLTQFRPYEPDLRPYQFVNGLIRVPFNWADDYHFDSRHSLSSSGLDISEDGIDIYSFHPIHLYLNTDRAERYQEAKSVINSGGHIEELRNTGPELGVRDLFIGICRFDSEISSYSLCRPLIEIVDALIADFS